MAYKSQCDELLRNITLLKEHASALESRQDELANDLIKKNENIIKQIIENEEATLILQKRINNLEAKLENMSKRLESQLYYIPGNIKSMWYFTHPLDNVNEKLISRL